MPRGMKRKIAGRSPWAGKKHLFQLRFRLRLLGQIYGFYSGLCLELSHRGGVLMNVFKSGSYGVFCAPDFLQDNVSLAIDFKSDRLFHLEAPLECKATAVDSHWIRPNVAIEFESMHWR